MSLSPKTHPPAQAFPEKRSPEKLACEKPAPEKPLPERLRAIARALRAQRRLAAAGRSGYDLDAHNALAREWRLATGRESAPEHVPRAKERPRVNARQALRAQAEALFAPRPQPPREGAP